MYKEFTSIFHEESIVYEGFKKDPSGAKIKTHGNSRDVSGSQKQVDRFKKREEIKNRTSNIVGSDRHNIKHNSEESSPKYSADNRYKRRGVITKTYHSDTKNGYMPGVKESGLLDITLI